MALDGPEEVMQALIRALDLKGARCAHRTLMPQLFDVQTLDEHPAEFRPLSRLLVLEVDEHVAAA